MSLLLCLFAALPLAAAASSQRLRAAPELQPRDDGEFPLLNFHDVSDDWQEPGGTQWNAFMERVLTEPLAEEANHNTRICMQGKFVPQLFLLGVQKAGTTSMGFDLVRSGVRSAIGKRKELHTFDKLCGFPMIAQRTSKQLHGKELAGRCEASDESVAQWLSFYRSCEETHGPALIDMTPLNLRIPGLAQLLQYTYGHKSDRLGFIINLREPMKRLHSGFYHAWNRAGVTIYPTFDSYVQMIFKRAPALLESGEISQDYPLDEFYRSMYGLTLRPWFAHFPGEQFALVAMKPYFADLEVRRSFLEQIFKQFSIGANPDSLEELTDVNTLTYPPLEEDLSKAAIAKMYDEFFTPDTKNLTVMLSSKRGKGSGALIPGYDGSGGAQGMYEFFQANW